MNLKRLLVAVTLALFAFSVPALAQNKEVTGKVTDVKDGSPLAGVTVAVKGTQIATATDANGLFKLKVPADAKTLTISSIGFATREVPAEAGEMSNGLSAISTSLNDVVVIGYGTSRKKDLTGSVINLTAKDFNKGSITTPEQLIMGKAAGVQITSNGGAPGAGSTIRIRGGASLNARYDPLIVIDGVP